MRPQDPYPEVCGSSWMEARAVFGLVVCYNGPEATFGHQPWTDMLRVRGRVSYENLSS